MAQVKRLMLDRVTGATVEIRSDVLDFPSSIAILRHSHLEHAPECSHEWSAALMCDCEAVLHEWKRILATEACGRCKGLGATGEFSAMAGATLSRPCFACSGTGDRPQTV